MIISVPFFPEIAEQRPFFKVSFLATLLVDLVTIATFCSDSCGDDKELR